MPVALGIILTALRAGEVIDWPWVWVTSPIWGVIAVNLVLADINKFLQELDNERRLEAERNLPEGKE